VRSFALESPLTGPRDEARFQRLALQIAQFQAKYSPGFARLVDRSGSALDRLDAIPAVPADAFRVARVAVHPPELDAVRFVTSGTTASERGTHAMRITRTYDDLSLHFGRASLVPDRAPVTIALLAASPTDPPSSSLGYMMAHFARELDGRPPVRWLVDPDGIDVAGLRAAAELAATRGEPLLVLATAFALVGLVDALDGAVIPLPGASVVMQTGGFKGRTRALEPSELYGAVARTFGIDERSIIGEYGMTELTSQLYEGRARGIYVEPPWCTVNPVDPISLEGLPDGEVGLARIVDLGNVDSAVAIITQDRVRRTGGGIELTGRATGAPPRGCSLAVEALLLGAADVNASRR
jgi:hypothetical protein